MEINNNRCKCGEALTSDEDFQPFPATGRLASNLNSNISKLKATIGFEYAEVYCYVVDTIKNRSESYFQTGSGPNFQGDLITLCTCKHFMRTFMSPKDWIGKWIAGFTNLDTGNRHNILVYLMKVGNASSSQQSLWYSNKISEETKQAKSVHINKFGDIFQPINQISDPFAVQGYIHPLVNHVHAKNNWWHKDINYEGIKGRHAALLIGDIDYSFLWNKPMVYYPGRLHRGQKKVNLQILLEQLEVPPK